MRSTPLLLATLTLLAAAFPALGSVAGGTSHTVTATNFAWTPAELQVQRGDVVTFVQSQGGHDYLPEGETAPCALPCTRTFPTDAVVKYVCSIHPAMKGVIVVGPRPDVSILAPSDGATVTGLVTVEGVASHAERAVVSVSLFVDDALVGTAPGGPAGAAFPWSLALNASRLTDGPHVLLARATDEVGRTRDASLTVQVQNPPTPELRAVSLAGVGTATTSATLSYSFRNEGTQASGAFVVRFEYLRGSAWAPIAEVAVADLAAGATRSGQVTWDDGRIHFGRYDVRMTVDAAGQVAERLEDNNVALGKATWFLANAPGTDPLP